jgi:transcriptional regulator with XRE-family HTH domain
MSISELDYEQDNDSVDPSELIDDAIDHPLHRIKEVRQQQGVSLRRVAQLLGAEVRELRREEEDTCDLPLSRLYQWQRALEVPVADLLVDAGAPLSAPVMERARLVRVMKTVAAIMEKAQNTSIQRLAQTLVDQLVEIMPELKGINPWHSVGQRRSLDEYGRIVERSYSDDIWREFWRES